MICCARVSQVVSREGNTFRYRLLFILPVLSCSSHLSAHTDTRAGMAFDWGRIQHQARREAMDFRDVWLLLRSSEAWHVAPDRPTEHAIPQLHAEHPATGLALWP